MLETDETKINNSMTDKSVRGFFTAVKIAAEWSRAPSNISLLVSLSDF